MGLPSGENADLMEPPSDMSLPERGPDAFTSPLIEAFAAAGVPARLWDFALLWDFGSLYQRDRSAEEETLFIEGLGSLPVWYGHARIVCWSAPRGERELKGTCPPAMVPGAPPPPRSHPRSAPLAAP